MSTANSPQKDQVIASMKMSSRDRSSSMMFALIAFFGVGVILLAVVFVMRLPSAPEVPPVIVESYAGTENPPGLERDTEPLQDEVEDMNEEKLDESLSSVSDFISAALDVGGRKAGRGDSRRAGPPGEGLDIVPAYERWELKFSARDVNGYAKTLDYFKMELAAVGGGEPLVEYAGDFSSTPKTHKGPGDQEKRLYFMYRNEGALLQYDRQLLKKAGINTENRTVLKFIPSELQGQLQRLELEYGKKNRGPNTTLVDIAKTIYECQVVGKQGYQWVVVDQRYRKPSTTASMILKEQKLAFAGDSINDRF